MPLSWFLLFQQHIPVVSIRVKTMLVEFVKFTVEGISCSPVKVVNSWKPLREMTWFVRHLQQSSWKLMLRNDQRKGEQLNSSFIMHRKSCLRLPLFKQKHS